MAITKAPDNSYQVRLTWLDSLGKRRDKRKKGFRTKAAAKEWEAEMQTRINNREFDVVKTEMTLNEVYKMWFTPYVKTVRKSTSEKHRRFMMHYVLTDKWFNNVSVSKITPAHLQQLVNEVSTQVIDYRRNLSHFRRAMDLAVTLGLITENPFSKISWPRRRPAPEFPDRVDTYTVEQLHEFIETAERLYGKDDNNYRVFALFRLLAFTGARRGELIALTWDDINFIDGTLTINKTMSTNPSEGVTVNPPKTRAGNRTIRLDSKTLEVMQHWFQLHKALYEKVPVYIFPASTLDKRMTLTSPKKYFDKILKETSLPRMKIHGFRHTYATLAVQSGMNIKSLQYQLGHDDVQTTLTIYASINEQMRVDTVSFFTSVADF